MQKEGSMQKGVFSKPILVEDPQGLQGPAVYLNFPLEKVVPQIKFKHPKKGYLTTEFWYNDNGQVEYDEQITGQVFRYSRTSSSPEAMAATSHLLPKKLEKREPWKYARLVTVNSHYEEVGWALVLTFLSISTVVTQMSLAQRCVGQLMHPEAHRPAIIYALLVVLKVIMWASISFWDATSRINTQTSVVGDLVKDLRFVDQIKNTVYTAFFHAFSIPTTLTDTSINLHVRKPVQPYVAFKNQGHRAWILGWPSKEEFQVVTQDRAVPNLILGAAFDLPLIITQWYLKLHGYGFRLDMLMTFIFSATCFVNGLRMLTWLMVYKRRLYLRLKELTEKSLADAEQEGPQSLKEYIVNHKLLQNHFYTKMPSDVLEKAREMGFGTAQETVGHAEGMAAWLPGCLAAWLPGHLVLCRPEEAHQVQV